MVTNSAAKYPCTGCGLCCQNFKSNIEAARVLLLTGDPRTDFLQEVASFPYKYDAAGRCEKLGDDNRCQVYENRPDMCDVVKMWEKHFADKIPLPEYFRATVSLCNSMIVEAKADDRFLIDPSII